MPEKGKEKWFGLGKEWKKEVGTYGEEKAKEREKFYGKRTILRLSEKLLGELKKDIKEVKDEELDAIIDRLKNLKEEKALTSNETIKSKKLEEKVNKGRVLSAILRDFFKKKCASKNGEADAFVALKYLKDFGNVDFVMAGEIVKINAGILEILGADRQVRARGYLIPAAQLRSPLPIFERTGPKTRKKKAPPPVKKALPPEKPAPLPTEEKPSKAPPPRVSPPPKLPEKPAEKAPPPKKEKPKEPPTGAEKPPALPSEEEEPPTILPAPLPPTPEVPLVVPPIQLEEKPPPSIIPPEPPPEQPEFEKKMDAVFISKELRKRITEDKDSPSQFSYQKETKEQKKYHIIGTEDIERKVNYIVPGARSFYLDMKIKASDYEKAEKPKDPREKTYEDLEKNAPFEVDKKAIPEKLDPDIDKAIAVTSKDLYEKGKTAKTVIEAFKVINKQEHLELGPGTTLFYVKNPEEKEQAKRQKYQIIVYPKNKIRIQIQDPNASDKPKQTGIIDLIKKDEVTPEKFNKRIEKIEEFLQWKGIISPALEVKAEKQPDGIFKLTFNENPIGYLLPLDPDAPENYRLLNAKKKQIGIYDSLNKAEGAIREKLLYPLIKNEILGKIKGFVLVKGEDTETYGVIEIRKNKKDKFPIGEINIEKSSPISLKILRLKIPEELPPLIGLRREKIPVEIPAQEIILEETYTYKTIDDLQKKLNEIFIEAEEKEKNTANQLKSKLETKYPEFKIRFLEKTGDIYKFSLSRKDAIDYFFEINPSTNTFTLLDAKNAVVKDQAGAVLQNLPLDKLPFITIISPEAAPICNPL